MKLRLTIFFTIGSLLLLALVLAQAANGGPIIISRVSTDSSGIQGDSDSFSSSISADGRYVAFDSDATNLVAGDNNGVRDNFIKDTQTGATTRVSTNTAGDEATGNSNNASVSADGRYVAFDSIADDLVGDDDNNYYDVFVKDTQTGITTRVSTGIGDTQADNNSTSPAISADGRYVAFDSFSTNLVPVDTNGYNDVFVKDTLTGAITSVSTDYLGTLANGSSYKPAISADGRHVAFYSDATDLVDDDTNGVRDIFIMDTQTGTTTRVSTDSAGTEANQTSNYSPSVSADGRYVAFISAASNLAAGDTNGYNDVYVKDTQTGATRRVSNDSAGTLANYASNYSPSISADGRYVAFTSGATNLVPGDTNVGDDVFLTRSSLNQAFTWYDNVFGANWVLFANPAGSASGTKFDLSVAGTTKLLPTYDSLGPGQVPAGGTLDARYDGLIGGPVDAGYHSLSPALVSQRILWGQNSLEEVVGTDTRKLSDHFYWTWYDQQSSGFTNWVLVANPGANPVYYQIKVAGVVRASGQIAPGDNVTPTFPGVIGGPVEVEAWADAVGGSVPAEVMASQRVLTNSGSAFNEVPGIPFAELTSDYLWTWYDQQSPQATNWVLIANPGGSNLYYEITIGDAAPVNGGPVAPGQNVTPTFPGTIGGPVRVRTFLDVGHSVPYNSIVSQRVLWGPSFEEVPGYPTASLTDTYHWTWYDQNEGPGVTNWVLIANPPDASGPIYYELKIGGMTINGGPIAPGQNETPTFPGTIGGPVQVSTFSDVGHTTPATSLSSQRVLWNGYFNEVTGTVLD